MQGTLTTFFSGYLQNTIYWAPLLAYGFLKGQPFVHAKEWGQAAMPLAPGATDWKVYEWVNFVEDGPMAVGQPSGLGEHGCSPPVQLSLDHTAQPIAPPEPSSVP